jgi:hypothetical protein
MTETLFTSWGPLRYNKPSALEPELVVAEQVGYKLILEVDQGIVNYYRDLMPPYLKTNPQMYAAHISVVRREVPPIREYWGKYEGEVIEFQYIPVVHHGRVYYWINCFSKRLEEIRIELGLPVSSEYTRPPDTFEKVFHCTIGNVKEHP